MLGEDITTGTIIYGLNLDVEELTQAEDGQPYNDFNDLASSVPGTMHIVPGDTIYAEYDGWSPATLLGVDALMITTDEAPCPVSLKNLEDAKAAFEKALPAIRALNHPIINAALEEGPQFYFTSFGPLSYASLALGKTIPSDDPDAATYKFHSSQDMDQMWQPIGVDGVTITSVDFTDIATVDLSPDRLERWKERVPEIKDPELFISVRYD